MTLYELSLEYARTADDLYRRILELERAGRAADSRELRQQLEGRARPLWAMYRDVRAVARHLEHYYDHRQDKPAPRRGGRRG